MPHYQAEILFYEPIKEWITGMGIVARQGRLAAGAPLNEPVSRHAAGVGPRQKPPNDLKGSKMTVRNGTQYIKA